MGITSLVKHIFNKEDEKTDDVLGVYPEKVHVPAFLERRYLKTSRALALFTIISMCLNIMFGSILYMQPSMVQSLPMAFSFNEQFQGFKPLEKMYVRKSANDLIFEEQIREYVYLRNKVVPDIDVMQYRWEPGSKFYWMSGSSVYSQFSGNEYTKIIKGITDSGYRKDIYFRWSRKIKPAHWVAEFDTYEYYDWQSKKAVRKRWQVYMLIIVNNGIPYGNLENSLKNPLNVSVVGYYPVSIAIKDEDE